jgi:hypothetical protein
MRLSLHSTTICFPTPHRCLFRCRCLVMGLHATIFWSTCVSFSSVLYYNVSSYCARTIFIFLLIDRGFALLWFLILKAQNNLSFGAACSSFCTHFTNPHAFGLLLTLFPFNVHVLQQLHLFYYFVQMRNAVLKALVKKSSIFWDVKPCTIENQQMFRKKMSPPSAESTDKPNKKPAWSRY